MLDLCFFLKKKNPIHLKRNPLSLGDESTMRSSAFDAYVLGILHIYKVQYFEVFLKMCYKCLFYVSFKIYIFIP